MRPSEQFLAIREAEALNEATMSVKVRCEAEFLEHMLEVGKIKSTSKKKGGSK